MKDFLVVLVQGITLILGIQLIAYITYTPGQQWLEGMLGGLLLGIFIRTLSYGKNNT